MRLLAEPLTPLVGAERGRDTGPFTGEVRFHASLWVHESAFTDQVDRAPCVCTHECAFAEMIRRQVEGCACRVVHGGPFAKPVHMERFGIGQHDGGGRFAFAEHLVCLGIGQRGGHFSLPEDLVGFLVAYGDGDREPLALAIQHVSGAVVNRLVGRGSDGAGEDHNYCDDDGGNDKQDRIAGVQRADGVDFGGL